jgi:hypothetical protein
MHGDGDGPGTVVDEAFVRTPNFAPDGCSQATETRVRTAIGCHLLAWRRRSFQPSPLSRPMQGEPSNNGRFCATRPPLAGQPASASTTHAPNQCRATSTVTRLCDAPPNATPTWSRSLSPPPAPRLGYACISTVEQQFDLQVDVLTAADCYACSPTPPASWYSTSSPRWPRSRVT